MASILGRELSNGGSVAVSATGVLTECKLETQSRDVNFVGFLKIENASSANFIVKIQHSVDNVNFEDLVTFTTVTGNGIETVHIDNTTQHVLRFVRANVTTHTAGTADVTCVLLYDRV